MRLRGRASPLLAAVLVASLAARASEPPLFWTREPHPGSPGVLHAVALRADGALAVARPGRIAWWDGSGRRGSEVVTPAVRELGFDARGALWVATDDGLFSRPLDAAGGLEDRSPPGGEAARDVRRLAFSDAWIGAATAAGVFLGWEGERWLRLRGARHEPEMNALIFAPDDATALFAGGAGGLFHAVLPRAPGARAPELRPAPLPLPGVAPLDLALDAHSGTLLVLHPRGIAERHGTGWRLHRPSWPPGFEPRRLVAALGRLWLLSDRGLLEAPAPAGPWRRAAPPLGTGSVSALIASEGRLLAAGASGLYGGAPGSRRAPVAAREGDCDPPIGALQRQALRHLGLEMRQIRSLRRGAEQRGRLPAVTLHAGIERERDAARDHDQAFLSGGLRQLLDRERADATEWELGVTLSWDLGELLHHPEEVDVSSEARRLIALRDDVLDELNQLYFERRRVLARLSALPPQAPEAFELELRAAELAAGLDAWTGGGFTQRLRSACP